jgi:hypothetical protein
MMQGTGWIAWEMGEIPILPAPKPARKAARERPVQEQQYGSNIDSMPRESNPPPPAHSQVMAAE